MSRSPFGPILYRYSNHKRNMPVPVMEERQLPPQLEAIAQQVLGREEDDFHWTVTELAGKLWGELRDIYLLTENEGDEQGWFVSTLYIRRNLRGPLEAAGLIEFQTIPNNRIEHLVRVTADGSALLGYDHQIQEETMIIDASGKVALVAVVTNGGSAVYLEPGIDYTPVEQEIAYEYLHRPSADDEQNVRVTDISGDTQPLDLPPARPPKLDTSTFFKLLDEEMAKAFAALEQDPHVIMRGHRDAIETIKRYVVMQQEQQGLLEYRIERHKEFEMWWHTQAERSQAAADRHAASLLKMADEKPAAPAPIVDPTMPRLSLVDVETLSDLAKKHTGGPLESLLEALHLPELEQFRGDYPTIHTAKAIIGKRIADYGYAVMGYHVITNRNRSHKLYLTVNYGFGDVNVFDRSIKEHFVKYPGGYDEWMTEGHEQPLDPPVQLIMSRDSQNYARIDDLFVVE